MKEYKEVVSDLIAMKDEKYRQFNERIVNVPPGTSIGVRMPLLRAYAKAFVREDGFDREALFSFPDDIFEIRLLKCLAVGYKNMPFAEKKKLIGRCVPVIDGWAVNDLFCSTLKEVKKHRQEFLPEIEKYIEQGTEFSQRFAYIMLLGCYMEREFLPQIFSFLERAHTQFYYTHMGAAWLIAEVLVRFFDEGVSYLVSSGLDAKTINKAIRKARESFRLSEAQKNYLKSLKK